MLPQPKPTEDALERAFSRAEADIDALFRPPGSKSARAKPPRPSAQPGPLSRETQGDLFQPGTRFDQSTTGGMSALLQKELRLQGERLIGGPPVPTQRRAGGLLKMPQRSDDLKDLFKSPLESLMPESQRESLNIRRKASRLSSKHLREPFARALSSGNLPLAERIKQRSEYEARYPNIPQKVWANIDRNPTFKEVGGLSLWQRMLTAFQGQVEPATTGFLASIALALGEDPNKRAFPFDRTVGELAQSGELARQALAEDPPEGFFGEAAQGVPAALGFLASVAPGTPRAIGAAVSRRALVNATEKALTRAGLRLPKGRFGKAILDLAASAPGLVSPDLVKDVSDGKMSVADAAIEFAKSPITLPASLAASPVRAAKLAARGKPGDIADAIVELSIFATLLPGVARGKGARGKRAGFDKPARPVQRPGVGALLPEQPFVRPGTPTEGRIRGEPGIPLEPEPPSRTSGARPIPLKPRAERPVRKPIPLEPGPKKPRPEPLGIKPGGLSPQALRSILLERKRKTRPKPLALKTEPARPTLPLEPGPKKPRPEPLELRPGGLPKLKAGEGAPKTKAKPLEPIRRIPRAEAQITRPKEQVKKAGGLPAKQRIATQQGAKGKAEERVAPREGKGQEKVAPQKQTWLQFLKAKGINQSIKTTHPRYKELLAEFQGEKKAAQPVQPKPVAAKPITAKPAAPKPVAAKPITAKPVTAKPVAVKPEQGGATRQLEGVQLYDAYRRDLDARAKKLKGVRKKIKISTGKAGETRQVDAEVFGDLAIHKNEINEIIVTHVPTGVRINSSHTYLTKKDARPLIQSIKDQRLDLSFTDPKAAPKSTLEGFKKAVGYVVSEEVPKTFKPPVIEENVISADSIPNVKFGDTSSPRFMALPESAKPSFRGDYVTNRTPTTVIKEFIKTVPEFKSDPFFTLTKGKLVYQDGGRFSFEPGLFGLDKTIMKEGQRVRVDLASFGIKVPKKPILKPEGLSGPPVPKPTAVKAKGEKAIEEQMFEPPSGPPRKYPKGVRQPPASFPVELMEATRRVKATSRFKRLGGSVRGRFKRTVNQDKIEVGDVRDAQTLSHEFGHAVDYALHSGKVMRSLKARVGTRAKEGELRQELKGVSYLLRGDPTAQGKPAGHIAYRHSAKELFADFISLWVVDPKKAREIAPSFTEGFEARVKDKTVGALLDELRAGNVEAVPGGLGRRPPGETIATAVPPGAPPPDELSITKPNPEARRQAFRIDEELVREAAVLKHRIYKDARKWNRLFSEKQRKDIGAFIEGIGNIENRGEGIRDVAKRMTPEMKQAAKKARFGTELLRQEVNKLIQSVEGTPEWIKYVEDYLGHFYHKKGKGGATIGELYTRWRKTTPHTQKRKFPTYAEAVSAGFRPITQDFAYNYVRAAENNIKAAVIRRMSSRLKKLSEESEAAGQRALITPNLKAAGQGYVKIDHPVLKRIYARRDKRGRLVLGESVVRVHPDLERPIKVLLDKPFGNKVFRAIQTTNSLGKSLNVLFSFFHEVTLYESSQAVNARFLNPLRGFIIGPFEGKRLGLGFRPRLTYRAGLLLEEKDPFGIEDGLRSGLVESRSAANDYARSFLENGMRKFEDKVRRIPGLKQLARLTRASHETYNRHLWDNVQPGFKLFSYYTLVKEILPRLPENYPADKAKRVIASHLNDAYGGQEFLVVPTIRRGDKDKLKLKFEPMTVKEQQIARALIFAPDWTWSNIRVAGRTIINFRDPVARKLGIRYWRNMAINLTAETVLVQSAIHAIWGKDDPDHKKYPWQNEPDRKWDIDVTPMVRSIYNTFGIEPPKKRQYIHKGKQAREILRYFEDFPAGLLESIGNKSSVVLRLLVEQGAGHQLGSGFPMPWSQGSFFTQLKGWERVKAQARAAAEQFIPFSWQPSNFAFAVPRRKGMTPYRAMRHYADAFDLISDPRISEAKRKAAEAVILDVDNAAKANNIAEAHLKNLKGYAKAEVSKVYGERFFEAFVAKDKEKMERAAERLINLGKKTSQVIRSIKYRLEKEGRKTTREERIRIREQFRRLRRKRKAG